jgi:hypothetical protein
MSPRDINQSIIYANDYRSFLRALLDERRANGEKVNFSGLSRRAGFASRSYIKEVLEGKKRVAAPSLLRFIKAFRLDKTTGSLFSFLVALEEEDVNFEGLSSEHLRLKIEATREKLSRRISKSKNVNRSDAFAPGPRAVEVFAALGSPERGASIEQIQSRSRLDQETCMKVLNYFLAKKIIRHEKGRYFLSQPNLDLGSLGKDLAFKKLFGRVIEELNQSHRSKLSSKEELFFYSAYSVRRSQLPEMKKRLRELLLEYIDTEQVDDGDAVVKTVIALYL